MKKLPLLSLVLLSSGCVHTSSVQRAIEQETISIDKSDALLPISIEQVNSSADVDHRSKAKELGISYVDYLHMVNNGKLTTTKSDTVIYHKH